MTITAEQVIDAARDLHPAFTVQRAPNPMCLRLLKRRYDWLLQRVVQVRPSALSVTVHTATVSGIDFSTGVAITNPVLQPIDAEVTLPNGDAVPVELTPYQNRFGQVYAPAAALLDQTLWPLGGSVSWSGYDTLRFRYIPTITTFVLTTALVLPDQALDPLAARLAATLAGRLAADGVPDVSRQQGILSIEADGAEQRFLEGLAMHASAEAHRTMDVTSG